MQSQHQFSHSISAAWVKAALLRSDMAKHECCGYTYLRHMALSMHIYTTSSACGHKLSYASSETQALALNLTWVGLPTHGGSSPIDSRV